MRLLITLTTIMIAFIIFAIYAQQEIINTCISIRDQLPVVDQAISSDNWLAAEQHLAGILQQWNQIQNQWYLIIVHQEIEAIEILFARLLSYIKTQEKPSALAELAALDAHFNHVYRNEMFSTSNIF